MLNALRWRRCCFRKHEKINHKSSLLENFCLILPMFNIIARKTLLEYCKKYPEAATALQEWYHELIICNFKNFNELKQVYGNASLVADDRVVFNIMGNKYRLVVRIVFDFKAIQVKWFGTHALYDKINVTIVQNKKK
jgi:mRNA interferase HigB